MKNHSVAIVCPDLDPPKYGSVRITTNRVGGKADYKCDDGFILVGVQWRKCQANGKWTGEAPTCKRKIVIGVYSRPFPILAHCKSKQR